MTTLTKDQLDLDPDNFDAVNRWLLRGDGIAVYENQDLGSAQIGHRKYLSFGGPSAQFETTEPPTRLPDMGRDINWRYTLIGIYKGELL